jgi:hypothetical protein
MTRNKVTRKKNNTSSKTKIVIKPKGTKMKNTTGSYKNIAYDSLEELAFLQWASELQKAGYIHSIQRSPSFLLSDSLSKDYVIQKLTSSKPAIQNLLQGHSYTPEFYIIWNKIAKDKFVWTMDDTCKFEKLFVGDEMANGTYQTYIEIKPIWDQNNMERLFKLNQKWMWQKHSIFVNLIKCPELFSESFTPNEYRTTKTGRTRTIKWEIKTLSQFINIKK